jgi:hypothetical protein
MEIRDFLECAVPVYLTLAMLAAWTAVQRRSWCVHAPITWLVGIVLTAVWWNTPGESGALSSLARLLEVVIESAVTVALPLVPATVAVALPNKRGVTFGRVVAWSGALATAFYSLATALVVHGWMTGDWL